MRHQPPVRRATLALAASLAMLAGCVSVAPEPTPAPVVTPAAPPTPTPAPTPRLYVVRPNDTLSRIANRFDLTVGQLLTANPGITDPNLLSVGQELTIPPPGAPDTSPTSGGLQDAQEDLVDPDDQPIVGEGYADITGLGIRVTRGIVRIELRLVSRPPARVDPEYELLDYTVVMDVNDDDQPDYRIKYGNGTEGSGGLVVSLEDRTTGEIRAGAEFPGDIETRSGAIIWTVQNAALGGGARYRIAANAERSYFPGGRADPEVESTLDHAPNQQWPRPNPRWVELGAPLDPAE
jgi:LysM repeat protein